MANPTPFPEYVPPPQNINVHYAPSGWGESGYADRDQSGIPHPNFWKRFAGSNPYDNVANVRVKVEPDGDDGLRTLRSRLRHLREDEPAPSVVLRGLRRLRIPTVDSPISRRVAARRAALGSIV